MLTSLLENQLSCASIVAAAVGVAEGLGVAVGVGVGVGVAVGVPVGVGVGVPVAVTTTEPTMFWSRWAVQKNVYVPGWVNVQLPLHGAGCVNGGSGGTGCPNVCPCVSSHDEGFGLASSNATLWGLEPSPARYV